jgi:hypothetical protein
MCGLGMLPVCTFFIAKLIDIIVCLFSNFDLLFNMWIANPKWPPLLDIAKHRSVLENVRESS